MASLTDATGSRGILRPSQVGSVYRLGRYPCDPRLDPYVEHYWSVRWALDTPRREQSSVLSHPAVHLSFEEGEEPVRHGHPLPSMLVHGVITTRFDIELAGRGRVLGVKFRPGGFTALTGLDASRFTDSVASLPTVVPGAEGLRDEVFACEDDEGRCAVAERHLVARLPSEVDPDYVRVRALVEDVAADRGVVRSAELARRHAMSDRTMQRLLRRYVGISAAWLIRRYRLLDAMTALQEDPGLDLAELALTLGWYDQSHLTRDFTAAVGVPPSRYGRGLDTGRGGDGVSGSAR